MRLLLKECCQLYDGLCFIYSPRSRLGNLYDERDLVLGHGMDNLWALRLLMALALSAWGICGFQMLCEPSFSVALAFFLLFVGICHYVSHLPRAGSTDALNAEARHAGERYALRSYLRGRIIFTPSGLKLSWHACSTPSTTSTPSASTCAKANSTEASLSWLQRVGMCVSPSTTAQHLLASTNAADDLPVVRSGFMTQHVDESLMDFRLYAGVRLSLEQLVQLTASQLPHLSKSAKKKLLPSQVCCLGFGFPWQPKHTRRLHELMEVGLRASSFGKKGSPDLHGVEDLRAFEPIYFSADLLLGHTLLLGTTGAGKTRFFDLLVSQAIMRGDTVIVIDPKGDRSLQQTILRASRFSEREPIENIYCLDIGREQSAPLSSVIGQNFAQRSNGLVTPLGANNQSASSLETLNTGNIQSAVANTAMVDANAHASPKLQAQPQSLLPEANGQWHATLKGIAACDSAAADGYLAVEAMTPLSSSNPHSCNNDKTDAVSPVSDGRGNFKGDDEAQECAWFFDHINTGFNPTSAFDRSSEIGARLTAMMPDSGSSASFKAYANMAVSAAVECCLLNNTKVSLEQIRSIVSNHDAFAQAFRAFLNRTVIELNIPEVTLYYNRLHSIKNPLLQSNCYAVSLLLGSTGEGTAGVSKEKNVLQILTENGCLDPLEAQEPPMPFNGTDAFCSADDEANADGVATDLDDFNIAAPDEAADLASSACKSSASRKHPLIVNKDPSEFVLATNPHPKATAATADPLPAPSPTKRRTPRKSKTTEDATTNSRDGSGVSPADPSAQATQSAQAASIGEGAIPPSPPPTKRCTTRKSQTTEDATTNIRDGSGASLAYAQVAMPTISLAAENAAAMAAAQAAQAASTGEVVTPPAPPSPLPTKRRTTTTTSMSGVSSLSDASASTVKPKSRTAKSSTAKAKGSTSAASANTASFKALLEFYSWLQDKHLVNTNYGIAQIITISSLTPDYYKRVTNGILPYLSALTSGELSSLLSSSEQNLPSFMELIKHNKIFYAALHCLKDSATGQALGKLLISDLAFVAGELNAKADTNHHRVSVFIDEAAELANESLVQLLNKARASKFAVTLATQCVADLSRRAGSSEAATQIIANCNNLISLRVNDPQSASVIASVLPQTVITERSSSQSCSEGLALNDSYATSRTIMQRESTLFPPSMLMQLPDFEFIARLANGIFYKGFIPLLCTPAASQSTPPSIANSGAGAVNGAGAALSTAMEDDIYQQSHLVDCGYQSRKSAATGATSSSHPDASHGNELADLCAALGLDPNIPYMRAVRKKHNAALAHSLYQSACRHDGNNLGEEGALNGCRPCLEVESSIYTGSRTHVVFTATSDGAYGNTPEQSATAPVTPSVIAPAAVCASDKKTDSASVNEQTLLAACNKFDRDYVTIHPEAAPHSGPLKLVAQQQQAHPQKVASACPDQFETSAKPSALGRLARCGARMFHGLFQAMRGLGVCFLKVVLTIFLSPLLLTLYRRTFECLVLLSLFLGISFIYHGTSAVTSLWDSLQVTCAYVHNLGQVLSHATATGIYELNTQIAINSSVGNRAWQVVVACQDLWILALSILILGLLCGQHFSLMAEMRHRSLMGLKKLTSLMGWPALILIFLVLLMLCTAFVFCVELSVLSAWVLTFTFGFHTACFYTQHLK